MDDKIHIRDKNDWTAGVTLGDNADLLYLLSQLRVGTRVRIAVNDPNLYCKIEICENEEEVFKE